MIEPHKFNANYRQINANTIIMAEQGETICLHKELSYKLVGLCMEVHREYGCAHNERIYHKLLIEKLEREKFKFRTKPRVNIYSKETGEIVGYYEPDLIIEEKVILELKAKPLILKDQEKQLSEYLKVSEYEVGYLINFGLKSLYFKRIIYSNGKKPYISKIKK